MLRRGGFIAVIALVANIAWVAIIAWIAIIAIFDRRTEEQENKKPPPAGGGTKDYREGGGSVFAEAGEEVVAEGGLCGDVVDDHAHEGVALEVAAHLLEVAAATTVGGGVETETDAGHG